MKKSIRRKNFRLFSYRPKFKVDIYYIEKKMGNFSMFQLVLIEKLERLLFKISNQKRGIMIKKHTWNVKDHEKAVPVR
jgi:hypothetical protein